MEGTTELKKPDSDQVTKTDAKADTKAKKGGGQTKKSNKPAAGGRARAKSTVLMNFEKNLKSNNSGSASGNKQEIKGIDNDRFQKLRAMFSGGATKNESEQNNNKETVQDGKSQMNPDRFKMFSGTNNQEETKRGTLLPETAPKVSIKDRINMLMKSKEETRNTSSRDPILEKLRETHLEEDEDSGDNYSDEEDNNLDISKEEDNDGDNDLEESEDLSDEDDEDKTKKEGQNKADKKATAQNKQDDLDKSESLEDF